MNLVNGFLKPEDDFLFSVESVEDSNFSGLPKADDPVLFGLLKRDESPRGFLESEKLERSGLSKREDSLRGFLKSEEPERSGLSKREDSLRGLLKSEEPERSGLSK
ncbi:hypothetical protein K9K77_01750, partial [Candidatus Babeliales bacterium]|nr:hypothetical protein [Candidatus Babeliales bacterium]